MKFPKLLVHSALAFLLVAAAHAQSTVGTIYGSVDDAAGAKVPGATVVIKDVKTQVEQTNKTDGHGEYQFVAVNPSDYVVTASFTGFKTETQTGVTVDANNNVNVSFTLVAGGVGETIEVAAGTTLVDTRESQIGETIDQQRLQELPSLNRDPYQLLQSVTGVSNFSPDILIGSRDGANFSVNGFPTTTSSFYLDGAQNNILRNGGGNKSPDVDALQEFRILTSNFDAEFGRSPGAVVNLITKSGTDKYHGDLYEFIRNNLFDAKPYFSFLDQGFINNLKQHQFGGTIGGPIPKLRQTFFFLDFAHVQLHTDDYVYPSQIQLPTPAEAMGDFTNDPLIVTTAQQAAVEGLSCNGMTLVICPTHLDPVAAAVMAFIPKANATTGVVPTIQGLANNTVTQGLGRIDYNGISRHSIEGTFFDSRGSGLDPTQGGTNQIFTYSSSIINNNTLNGIIADNWIISNSAVNSLRGYYSGNRSVIANAVPNHLASDLGAAYPIAGPVYNTAPPRWNLGNDVIFIGGNNYGPDDVNQQTFGLVDVATLTKGKHSIKVGASYVWDKYSEYNSFYDGGLFTINTDLVGGGDRYIDFLTGKANDFEQTTPQNFHRRNFDPAIFFQDNWHILPRLSLNLGIRWEVYPPFHGDGTSGSFRAGEQSTTFPTAPVGILYEGDRGIAPGIANTPYTDFAPRFGFAWDVFGDGRTSLRGGYGIFDYQQVVFDEDRYQMPFGLSETLGPSEGTAFISGYSDPYKSSPLKTTPFPYVVSTTNPQYVAGAVVYATPPNGGSTPYAEEYNLSVEQQFTNTYALRVSYVGSGFIKQLQAVDINAPAIPTLADILGGGAATDSLSRRPYEPYGPNGSGSPTGFYYGTISMLQNRLNTNYNSLQATLRGRLGRQINLNASYVWSKAMDNASPSYPLWPRSGYGPSNLDIRNRFVLSALIGLPKTHRFGWFGREVVNGWRINDLTYIQSGTPFFIYTDTDENHDGIDGNDRPNQTCLNPYNTAATTHAQKAHEYVIPSCFLAIQQTQEVADYPAQSAFNGDERRNSLRLPSTTSTNLSMFKEFSMPRETRLQFRVEAFNAFNHVNFTTPRTDLSTLLMPNNLNGAGFFQLQNTLPPRVFQFGLRLIY